MKGATANFTKVSIGDAAADDTMHRGGRIRIINEVVTEGNTVFCRTIEATAAVNPENNMNGLTSRWWR